MPFPRTMNARVRFSCLLAPVLSDDADGATVARVAAEILRNGRARDLDVVPLCHDLILTANTPYAIRAGFADWHGLRLLIQQGRLPADPLVRVRVHLTDAQWQRAGLVARVASLAQAWIPGLPGGREQTRPRA